MDTHAELETLLADLLDGPPDVSRNQRLDALLRAHPELQADYLDHLQLHALLQWRAGKVPQPRAQVAEPEKAQPVSRVPIHWRPGRGVAAALLVLAASVAAFFLWQIPEAQATPDLFESLVDLNLELTQARTSDERNRIYDEQAANLKATLAKADLPDQDRKVAETLLENSTLLAKKVDPVAEADRFDAIAAQLVARMDAATEAKDEKRMIQLAGAYTRLTEVGVTANLVFAANALDVDKKQKLERRNANRATQVADIIDRSPEPSRKVIHRVMKGHFKKGKKH